MAAESRGEGYRSRHSEAALVGRGSSRAVRRRGAEPAISGRPLMLGQRGGEATSGGD